MDWNFAIRAIPRFARALWVTVNISVWAIALSLVIGIVAAGILTAHVPVMKQITRAYIELSRNTPLLVQLYFIYFGLPKLGIRFSPVVSAIIGLAFLGGSYMAEALRAGFDAVPRTQWESGQILSFSPLQTFVHIIIPQAVGTAMPSLVANVIFLIKESSVVSAIALADIMYVTKEIMGSQYNTYEALFLLTMSYVLILLPLSVAGSWLERKFNYAQR